jgi:sugar phosphate isomerase/epimerase
MKFGICCGLGSFPLEDETNWLSSIPRLMDSMTAAGADYVEFGVASVMPAGGQALFEALRDALANQPLKVEAFNGFIPGHHRITGPDVDLPAVLGYCRTALTRCKAIGGEVVVLGSAGARKVPAGFEGAHALRQFVQFARELGPIAEEVGIDIAIEPLNHDEDNLINSVEHGAQLVDEIAQPRIALLADFYHMFKDDEPVEHVAAANGRLRHTHLADLGRVAPGFAAVGEADFIGFFRNLRRAGYDGRCSFEGSFQDIGGQSRPALALMRRRFAESAEV